MKNWNGCSNSLRSLIKNTVNILLFFICLSASLRAQQDTTTIPRIENPDSVFVMQKSSWGAVLRSAIIPGLGQIYNESYYKAPIIWGLSTWFIYEWIQANDKYKSNRDLFVQTGDVRYQEIRTFYRDKRDEFAIYMGIVYFLNLVDAYVDAHLFDFSVEENKMTGSSMLKIKFNF